MSTTFSQRMTALLRTRAQKQPLAEGFIHCPFEPTHHIPEDALCSHIAAVHANDQLASLPNAMYASETAAHRQSYIQDHLYESLLAEAQKRSKERRPRKDCGKRSRQESENETLTKSCSASREFSGRGYR